MIIKELSKFIFLDEIRVNANHSELYFISHLLDNELPTLPDDWPGRIYTSKFIFDVLAKRKEDGYPTYFRTLLPNVPIKLKSKEKTITVTMFETKEITNSVMFFFDDGVTSHLYTGVFTEIEGLYHNQQFMVSVQKGIDNVYIDTTRCDDKSYIFTEDTVQEIKEIAMTHPDLKIVLIIPSLGYEKLLVNLIKEFPEDVYPSPKQRKILSKLGHSNLLAKTPDARMLIAAPGVNSDTIESNGIVTVYIIQGKAPTTTTVCGMYLRQWSPIPSIMDLQSLLDIIRPKRIIPIQKVPLEYNKALPECLRWFTEKRRPCGDEVQPNTETNESRRSDIPDHDSVPSSIVIPNDRRDDENDLCSLLQPTGVFLHPGQGANKTKSPSTKHESKSPEIKMQQKLQDEPDVKVAANVKSVTTICEIPKKRRRFRQNHVIDFADSSDDD